MVTYVYIQLNSPLGSVQNVDLYAQPSGLQIGSGVTASYLLTSRQYSVPNGTTTISVVPSNGPCIGLTTSLNVVYPTTTTTTTTSTTTTTTTIPITAQISVYGEQSLITNNIVFTAMVDSGSTLDNLRFVGILNKYSNLICTTSSGDPYDNFDETLNSGSTTISSVGSVYNGDEAGLKIISLTVNGVLIDNYTKDIVISGRIYRIVGWNFCNGL